MQPLSTAQATPAGLPGALVMLPGLGADRRFLHHQAAAFPGLIIPDWLEPRPPETLNHYALRMAESLAPLLAPRPRPWVISGISMGGMLSLGIAEALRADAVIMISACRHPRAINRALWILERVGRALPSPLIGAMRISVPATGGLGTGVPASDRRLLHSIAFNVPVPFIRWAARAIFAWPGSPVAAPVFHIHGTRDRVIPLRRVNATHTVRGGSHLLNLSHAAVCNGLIAGIIASLPR